MIITLLFCVVYFTYTNCTLHVSMCTLCCLHVVLVLCVCLFCTVSVCVCACVHVSVGHGGASCGGPAARGRAKADCSCYTGKKPSKTQNEQHKSHWIWCRCVYDDYAYSSRQTQKVSHVFSSWLSFCLFLFLFNLTITPGLFCPSRRLNSFVWRGCRLMNSYVRSLRVTDQLTGREGKEEMAVPMLPRPLHIPLAPTMVGGVGVEATATALDMVGSL